MTLHDGGQQAGLQHVNTDVFRSGERRVDRLTDEEGFQGRQKRLALFAEGREVAAQARERSAAALRAEAAGNLLLDFDHAQIPLGLFIVEGHDEVVEEQEGLVLIRPETVQEVAHWRLFASSALPFAIGGRCGGRRLGILGESLAQERLIAGDEIVTYRAREVGGAGGTGLFDRGAHLAQQMLELSGPRLVQLFLHKGQLAQVVGIT